MYQHLWIVRHRNGRAHDNKIPRELVGGNSFVFSKQKRSSDIASFDSVSHAVAMLCYAKTLLSSI